MVKKIKAVIFDIGGVLQLGKTKRSTQDHLHVSGVHEIVAKKLKISLDQYFDAIDSVYAKSVEVKISKEQVLDKFSHNLNYPKNKLEKLYYRTYKKRYRKNKYLYKIAKKLKNKGYKIAILSDQWHLSKKAHTSKKDIGFFDKVIISCDVGIRKPKPQIYKLVLKKLKVHPNESIFIDNQTWNTIPANKLGMNTILFVNNKKIKKQLKDFGIDI